ncbi:tRNA guanosine(34) transglycosylase Tgt [Candidatus Saccharibacteria bacterium]|nr:tRNA guanosine(34) transglycosylase Tgt [Candidatus Saccharibacteria bacterium]
MSFFTIKKQSLETDLDTEIPQTTTTASQKRPLMRAGIIKTAHGEIETPAFVGAATCATVKALTNRHLETIKTPAILVNTYHLLLTPGPELIAQAGGINKFTNWQKPTFSDSGGFQMLSLPDAKVDSDGVTFKSHRNGDTIRMTPESSMRAQWQIGADIHMAFDQAADSRDHSIMKQAMLRTHAWLPENLETHELLKHQAERDSKPYQSLYAVVQGGLFPDLRQTSAEFMKDQPVDGFGIGSLYTTETPETAAIIKLTNEILPVEKPRHLLGMGSEPRDLFLGVLYGCDTFDCVGPTRLARNGALYSKTGRINIKNAKYRDYFAPLDETCPCELCQNHTLAYLHHLFKTDEITGKILATIHNETFVIDLMQKIRQSIQDDTFGSLMTNFMNSYYN